MAEVFRPTYTCIDPETGKRRRKKSRTWHIRYYTPDGVRHRVKGYKDKKATETRAAELERRGLREAAGLTDPLDEHAKKPLAEHAADFRRYLASKGNTPDHVATTLSRLFACLDGCRFVRITDLQPSAVVSFLADLRATGRSLKTANEYLAAAKSFTRWLWRDKRTAVDPLAGLSRLASKGDVDVRHARRDFEPDELQRLLDAARQSPKPLRRLSGIDRYFLYLTACATGFRAKELASLLPDSFDLKRASPTVRADSACTKNKKQAVQPLPADVATALTGYLRDKPAGVPVWPGEWKKKAFLMIQADLKEARRIWLSEAQNGPERERREQSGFLAYVDAEGRYADFHALRHSYITAIGKTGAAPKVHQELARHSTYALTGRYTHARLHDLAATVAALPPLVPLERESLAATGTEGRQISLGPNLGPQPAIWGDFLRQTEMDDRGTSQPENPGKIAVFASFPGSGAEGEKVAAMGFEPMTSRL